MSEGQLIDTHYYYPLFLHYYGLSIDTSRDLPYDHFLALAKGVEVIEARRTHGLVSAINIVLNGDNDKFQDLVNLAFNLNRIQDDGEENVDETMKRLDAFIEGLTKHYR